VSARAGAGPIAGAGARAGPRIAVLLLGLAAVYAAGTGAAQLALFSRSSDLKFAVTVILPVLLVSVVASREPVVISAFMLIALAPFGGFDTTLGGVQVPLIAPLCVGAAFVALVAPGEIRRTPTNPVPIALAGVLLAVPLLSGPSPAHYAGLLATLGAAGFVAARACSRPGGTRIVLAGLVTSAVIQASIELWQLRTGQALNFYGAAGAPVLGRDYFYQFESVIRPSGSLYDPISLGNILALALPAAIGLGVSARSLAARLAWAGAGMWIMLALVLTLSRMSWIAGVVGAVVVVVLQERGRFAAALAVAGAVALVLTIGFAVDGTSLGQRLDSVVAPTKSTTANHAEDQRRTQIWTATGEIIAAHPIAGVGFGELQYSLVDKYPDSLPGIHAHSTYLQVLAEGGLLAGLAFATALLAAILTVARAVRRRVPYAAALAGSLVAILVCWTTDYTARYLAVGATFAVVFGAISALRNDPGDRGPVGA
jgi:O-antigen ligase